MAESEADRQNRLIRENLQRAAAKRDQEQREARIKEELLREQERRNKEGK